MGTPNGEPFLALVGSEPALESLLKEAKAGMAYRGHSNSFPAYRTKSLDGFKGETKRNTTNLGEDCLKKDTLISVVQ